METAGHTGAGEAGDVQVPPPECACRVKGCAGRGDGGGCLLRYGWHLGSDLWWHAPANMDAAPGGGKYSYAAAVTRTNRWLDALSRKADAPAADAEVTQEMPAVTVTPPGAVLGATEAEIRAHLDACGLPGPPPGDRRFYYVEWQGLYFVALSPGPRTATRHAPVVLDAEAKLLKAAEAEEALRRLMEETADALEDLAVSVRNRDHTSVLLREVTRVRDKLARSLDDIEVSDAALELLDRRNRAHPGG